ncbi:MAG: diguanylate cyclase [Actinomycetota bacterium]
MIVRRVSLLLLTFGVAALPVGIGAAMAAHGSATAALDGALANRATGQTQLLQDYFAQARAIALITAQNRELSEFFELPGKRTDRLAAAGPVLAEINAALSYLERLYPEAIGEACVIDSTGAEVARVVQGQQATVGDLSLNESANTFFAPSFNLPVGEVYHAAPYISPDTHDWVISNSTLLPNKAGIAEALVHFEISIESFRKTAAQGSQFPVLVVDRHTGSVVIDSAVPQRLGAALGRGDTDGFPALRDATSSRGALKLEGKRAAYQVMERSAGNANDWAVVAIAPKVIGPLYGAGTWPPVLGGLALMALLLGAIGMRFAQRDLMDAATTDHLTGLANRRQLKVDLAAAARRASSEQPVVLLMYDLNGFKEYNDAFGHSAGDAMLARMGANLRSALGATGKAYRLGGDEFCVIAPLGADGNVPVIAAATSALRERGQGFHIDASYGAVTIPHDTDDGTEALHLVDQRMYARKTSRRRSADRQTKDVLLRALYERHPELSDRFRRVADLADAVSVELHLGDEERRLVRQAAELHDIGKVAIPDEILDKEGSLTAEEWAFIRRHSVIGERILAAAPSLSYAAKLVRSANEWFDGSGYPDGVAGEAIPLGSRIIAVCDAFVAVTSHRSYAQAMPLMAAVEEIRRCAGTQFDPRVVAVFSSVIGDADNVQLQFEKIVSTYEVERFTGEIS